MDTQIKTLLYPHVMAIETALKNYTLEAVLSHASSEDFDEIFKTCLTAYRGYAPGSSSYKKSWANRLRLRQTIDGLISREQAFPRSGEGDSDMGHFRGYDIRGIRQLLRVPRSPY